MECHTRRFVRYTTPDLHCLEYAPPGGCRLLLCIESVVRGGDWYSVCSPGSGVYPPLSVSITQLFLRLDMILRILPVPNPTPMDATQRPSSWQSTRCYPWGAVRRVSRQTSATR
jgi:hypothetical protein